MKLQPYVFRIVLIALSIVGLVEPNTVQVVKTYVLGGFVLCLAGVPIHLLFDRKEVDLQWANINQWELGVRVMWFGIGVKVLGWAVLFLSWGLQ